MDLGPGRNKEDTCNRSEAKVVGVAFVDDKTEILFEKLKNGKFEEKQLYKNICKAIENIKQDHECGIKIPKAFWPKYYDRYTPPNLWKYNLPNAWRLIYMVKEDDIMILGVILEWFDNKDYEKRFGYKTV